MVLLQPFSSPAFKLHNRCVMAPMTRCRAEGNLPNALMAEYYGQRARAGLIITEGTSPSPNGLGYARIPGLFNDEQMMAWRQVTHAVHRLGGKIFVQLMHCGRVASVANLPAGAEIVGPTDVVLPGEIWTDGAGMQPHGAPRALTAADIAKVVGEFVQSAKLAMAAGFDGVELHAANGYLLEQFLNANVNTRTDGYGGSDANRNRLTLEVAAAVTGAIGAAKVGVRVSPYGVFNATGAFDGLEPQYYDLARQLGARGLAYLHLVDHSSMGAPEVPAAFKVALKRAFGGTFIASGGYTLARANDTVRLQQGELVAFGRPWIANPDLIERMENGIALAEADAGTFYTPGAKGYTDYPRAVPLKHAAE